MQRSKELLEKRAQIIRTVREFFWKQGFLETDTPTLVVSPGMEPHIRPICTERPDVFLPTSPEFAMKRLLAQGFKKIFQVSKAYRNEPKSATHNPEFAMLEWYRADAGYEEIMDDVEGLFGAIAHSHFPDKTKTLESWVRISVEEAFREHANLELVPLLGDVEGLANFCVKAGLAGSEVLERKALEAPGAWDDFFFRVMLNLVEPGLERTNRPVILHSYPASQCALANLYTDSRGIQWAKRFEVYAGGFELGNAFDELTDAKEQRARFEKDMKMRRAIYGSSFRENPTDEKFLAALPTMPRSGGIAMGLDRIVMYFLDARSIHDVLWLESHWPDR